MAYKQKILFRADAGAEIGYGHFIRTLALADMLKDDFECVLYTQAPSEYQRKECEKVCKLVELPADETRFQLFLDGEHSVFQRNISNIYGFSLTKLVAIIILVELPVECDFRTESISSATIAELMDVEPICAVNHLAAIRVCDILYGNNAV